MSDMKHLLEERKRIKAKKPAFRRQDSHKKKETSRTGWRHPRGIHSKMREGRRGYRIKISIGWKSPRHTRGLDPSGLMPILVHRPEDLTTLNPKTHGAIISSRVGDKKRLAILQSAGSVRILNIKDNAQAIATITATLAKRKEQAKKAPTSTPTTPPPARQPLETKIEPKTEPKTKEEEKREQDKMLTKRET